MSLNDKDFKRRENVAYPGRLAMIKAKEGFLIEKMMDGYMIFATGKNADSFNAMIQTNKTGALYWHLIEKGTSLEELTLTALNTFEGLDKDTAVQDIEEYLENISPAIEIVEL